MRDLQVSTISRGQDLSADWLSLQPRSDDTELPIDAIADFVPLMQVHAPKGAGTATPSCWEMTISVCQTNCTCGTTICVTQAPCITSAGVCGC